MTTSGQRQGCGGIERRVREDSGVEAREGGGGDHGGVIGREGATREEDLDAGGLAALFESVTELCVCGDATRNENRGGAALFGGSEGAIAKIADDGILKFTDKAERLR